MRTPNHDMSNVYGTVPRRTAECSVVVEHLNAAAAATTTQPILRVDGDVVQVVELPRASALFTE
jgi:hypothetical protein